MVNMGDLNVDIKQNNVDRNSPDFLDFILLH